MCTQAYYGIKPEYKALLDKSPLLFQSHVSPFLLQIEWNKPLYRLCVSSF